MTPRESIVAIEYCLKCWEECNLCGCESDFSGELDSERPDPVPDPFESDEPVKTKRKRPKKQLA